VNKGNVDGILIEPSRRYLRQESRRYLICFVLLFSFAAIAFSWHTLATDGIAYYRECLGITLVLEIGAIVIWRLSVYQRRHFCIIVSKDNLVIQHPSRVRFIPNNPISPVRVSLDRAKRNWVIKEGGEFPSAMGAQRVPVVAFPDLPKVLAQLQRNL
jgi:hypothetical protein